MSANRNSIIGWKVFLSRYISPGDLDIFSKCKRISIYLDEYGLADPSF